MTTQAVSDGFVAAPRSWWLRLGTEQPAAVSGCWAPKCDTTRIEPVDVYCHMHERFLPLTTETPSRIRPIVINVLRAVVCGGFLLTARLNSSVPVFVVAAGLGGAMTVLPLRRYRVGWRAALAAWVVVCLGSLAIRSVGPSGHRLVGTLLLGATLAIGVLYFGHVATLAGRDWSRFGRKSRAHEIRSQASSGWPAAIATAAALTPATIIAYLALETPFVARLFLAPAPVRAWLLVVALSGITGSLLLAVIAGVLLGNERVDGRVRPLVKLPAAPVALQWRPPVARWDVATPSPIERVARAVHAFLVRLAAAAVVSVRSMVNLVRRLINMAAVAAVRLLNWAHRRLVMGCRRVLASLVATRDLARAAGRLSVPTARRTGRVLLLPIAGLAGGAILANAFAQSVREYLTTGSLLALTALGAGALGGAAALAVVWLALSHLPLRRSIPSWGRSVSIAGANGLLVVAVGGWVVGLPGTFGHGPIRVGWVTTTSTLLLVVASVWTLFSRRTPAVGPSTPQDAEPTATTGATTTLAREPEALPGTNDDLFPQAAT
jgi:hypothetical protein